jgi:6,7-dimethyl-8-ribityllumazine synthase
MENALGMIPRSFDLTIGRQFFAGYTDVDAIILLGFVTQGETRHFDLICLDRAGGRTDLD